MPSYPNHGQIDGPVVLIGFGSIGQGTLPLIERHFTYDPHRVYVIDPSDEHRTFLEQRGVHFIHHAVTEQNCRALLTQLFPESRGFCVNLSVDTSSLELVRLCRELGVLYVDTVVEPWAGFYFDLSIAARGRSNYALREAMRAEKRARPGGPTAVSCCGANPGMVSWLLKEALLRLAADLGRDAAPPAATARAGRGSCSPSASGACTSPSATPRPAATPSRSASSSTPGRSRASSPRASSRPSSAGAPTSAGSRRTATAIRPAARRRSGSTRPASSRRSTPGPPPPARNTASSSPTTRRSRSPTTTRSARATTPEFRPTCHYAYHPCDQAVLSLHETLGSGRVQEIAKILDENEILWGADELGVLLYGHERNALWYGSRLSIKETRALAPFQNATGLQVTSAVIAGMAWALRHPQAGIVETDEMDHAFCLEVQRPYLGRVEAHYTDWTPIATRWPQFAEEIDEDDPWQFQNVLAT